MSVDVHGGSIDLKETVAKARKSPLNFGLVLDKKAEIVLKVDRRKTPEFLFRKAKESATGTKGASGVLSVDGKTLVFDCAEKLPSGLQTALKAFLKSCLLYTSPSPRDRG